MLFFRIMLHFAIWHAKLQYFFYIRKHARDFFAFPSIFLHQLFAYFVKKQYFCSRKSEKYEL